MHHWVYYSSSSGNTQRLIDNAQLTAHRIARNSSDPIVLVDRPFILITPSFSNARGEGAVPKPVIAFLNNPDNRKWLKGVVGCGDRNFGRFFAYAADVVARKCQVPVLHRIEISGVDKDFEILQQFNRQLLANNQ